MPLSMWNTFYVLAQEERYSGDADTPVYANDGSVIAMAPRAFVAELCIEGSGMLRDGRVVNVSGSCTYGPSCNELNPTVSVNVGDHPLCYHVLGPDQPWGSGSSGPLVPLRTFAVDPHVIPLGSRLYLPAWDGVYIPKIGSLGGFTHDGCFMAGDTGGAIQGNHFDFFAGTHAMMIALDRIRPSDNSIFYDVYVNDARCNGVDLTRPPTGSRAGHIAKEVLKVGAVATIGGGALWWAITKEPPWTAIARGVARLRGS